MSSEVEKLKSEGTAAFTAKDFDKAVDLYSKAIELDPTNHVLYSNRSASFASLKNFQKAFEDAEKTTEINPDWGKGWSRKGAALHGLGDLVGAKDAYEKALNVEPQNSQAKSGLKAVDDAIAREAADDGQSPDLGLGKMFSDPNLIGKLAVNPTTKQFLADPSFVSKLSRLQKNPSLVQEEIMKDQRLMQVMGVLLGIDMSFANPGAAGGEGDFPMEDVTSTTQEKGPGSPSPPTSKPSSSSPTKEPEPRPDSQAEPIEDDKALAEEQKVLGNAAYKKREFTTAVAHYQKAWDLYKDITFLNNMSAAYFEGGEYEKAIEAAQKAIDEGREIRADFKLIAKAFGRLGTSYQKKGDLGMAIEYFQKSLTEHRTPDILAKLHETEKAKTEADRLAYISPELADKAREEGNKLFKESDYPGSVKAYSESIKRAPEDPRGYGNRAASYIKLASFREAIKDCDKAIELDANFVKAHIRKAASLFALQEYQKSLDACTAATTADTQHAHTHEIEQQVQRCMSAMYSTSSENQNASEEEVLKRAQRDPEVLAILQDPVMQQILGQMKENPGAVKDHMANPMVREKIMKLVNAGIIKMGR